MFANVYPKTVIIPEGIVDKIIGRFNILLFLACAFDEEFFLLLIKYLQITNGKQFIAFIKAVIKNCRKNHIFFALGSFFFTIVVMYYYFCISFPFTCTQNIRYAVPLILLGACGIGYAYSKRGRIIKTIMLTLTILFSVFSSLTYFLIRM